MIKLYHKQPDWKWLFVDSILRHHDYKSFLELGVGDQGGAISMVECDFKVGVDSDPSVKHSYDDVVCKTTDEYFESIASCKRFYK